MPVPILVLPLPKPATTPADAEETQVVDPRGAVTPSQHIELRLVHLRAGPTFISQMQQQMNRRVR